MNMPKHLQYFAVKITDKPANPAARTKVNICLVGMNETVAPGTIYWGGSPSHCGYAHYAGFEKLKDYGWDFNWDDDFDVDMEFAVDFPPEPCDLATCDRKDTEGMLSPDGVFYQCDYGSHTSLCRHILRSLRIEPKVNPEDHLIRQGWLSVRHITVVGDDDLVPTKAQLDWLLKALVIDPSYRKKAGMFMEILSYRGLDELVEYFDTNAGQEVISGNKE